MFTIQNLIHQINWRQILTQLVASYFVIFGLYTFSLLYDPTWAKVFRDKNIENEFAFWGNDKQLERLLFVIGVSTLLGIVISLIFSYSISIKRNYFRANTVIVLLLLLILIPGGSLKWIPLKNLFWLSGQMTDDIVFQLVLNGLLLMTIGCLLFFSKYTRQFIESKIAKGD